jgi:hypothetical protein
LFEHDLFGKPVPTFPDHALWRFRHVAPPMAHCKTDQQSKLRDERIAFVLEVEFKPLG